MIRDRNTSRPRGFGFVTFKDEAAIEAVMAKEVHMIDGKEIDVKRSHQKESQSSSSKKLFVGGMPNTVTQEDMHGYFSGYGPVTEAQVMYDHMTGRSRGFGFVMFEQEEHAQTCLFGGPHRLNGELVDVKPATPKVSSMNKGPGGMGGGMRDGSFSYPYPYPISYTQPQQQYMPHTNYMPGYHMYGGSSGGNASGGTGYPVVPGAPGPQMSPLMMMHPAGQLSLSPTAAAQHQSWFHQPHPFVYSAQEVIGEYPVGGRNGSKQGRDAHRFAKLPHDIDKVSSESVTDTYKNNNNTSTATPPSIPTADVAGPEAVVPTSNVRSDGEQS